MMNLLTTFILSNVIEFALSDDYVDYKNKAQCPHYETNNDDNCTHALFPKRKLSETAKVRECCAEHSFMFHFDCETSSNLYGKMVCQTPIPGSRPRLPEYDVKNCRKENGCFVKKLHESEFAFDTSGSIQILRGNQDYEILDYCTFYECFDDWKVMIEACVCSNESFLEKENQMMNQSLTRCCPDAKLGYMPNHSKDNNQFTCVSNIGGKSLLDNPYECKKGHLKTKPFQHDLSGSDACVSLEIIDEKFIRKSIIECYEPCNGKRPCLRTCFDHFVDNKFSALNSTQLKIFDLDESNLDVATPEERLCTQKMVRYPRLQPNLRCSDKFEIFLAENDTFLLNTSISGIFAEDEFCLSQIDSEGFQVEICRANEEDLKFKFYPYILVVSCIFLFITTLVYSVFPKLLNYYTRILRFYCGSMFLAFLVLSADQFRKSHPESTICKISGFAQYYLFLTTFTFMTIMSVEVKLLIEGKISTKKRYFQEVCCGFLIPAFMTFVLFVFEQTLPRCSSLKPRFGEISCFFADDLAKSIWFLLPIALALIVNFIFFISTLVGLCKLEWKKKRLLIVKKENIHQLDNFLLFVKLFFGMGLMWSFEIVAYLTSGVSTDSAWYATDIINMCQGFYIFLVFVCKKSVWEAVTRKMKKKKHQRLTSAL